MPDDSTRGAGVEQRADRSRLAPTRRGFVKAAGAAGIGVALGTSASSPASAATDNAPPALERESRDSNLIVDPDGNRVTLCGVNTPDPYRAARDSPDYKVNVERYVQYATSDGWQSDVIRVPLQPNDIARQGAGSTEPQPYTEEQLFSYLEDYVDPVVRECAKQGVYCILDYHRHLESGPDWDDPDLSEELHDFWDVVAPRYDDESHVIYELFNEPTTPYPGHDLGPANDIDVTDPEGEEAWLDWREQAQPWVDTVREHSDTLLLIGNPRWSQWTYWAPEHEFEGENLAYVGHFYTQDGLRPLSTYFGEPSEEVPVFITEFGWGGPGEHLSGTADEHADEFTEFFETYDACHPVGWCFDFDWEPSMLDQSFEIANDWGQWMYDHLQEWDDRHAYPDPTDGIEAPPAPDDAASSDVGATAVQVDWSPVDDADCYNVYLDTGLYDTVEESSTTITGLEDSELYLVGVNAQNGGGVSETVEFEVITDPDNDTGEEAPDPPGDLWIADETETSLEVAWEAVDDADAYVVSLDGEQHDETDETSLVVDGLDAGTTYEVGVQAVNDEGSSLVVSTEATTEGGDADGNPCEAADAADGEQLENDDWVCDVNGDGNYRDVDASGDVTAQDLGEFFGNQHRDPWDSRDDLFDFNGDGNVGQPDVVDLFQSL